MCALFQAISTAETFTKVGPSLIFNFSFYILDYFFLMPSIKTKYKHMIIVYNIVVILNSINAYYNAHIIYGISLYSSGI
jgi:hypothetical protein